MVKYLIDFQKKAAVPASVKLGTARYLDAAYGSALELERAQTRYCICFHFNKSN